LARGAAGYDVSDQEPEIFREFLAFVLDNSPYAVPVERVREIIRLREITPMPRVPGSVLGVVALRGEIVQVVDGRTRMGLELAAPTRRSRIIVLHGEDNRVTGVLVDAVEEVLRVPESEIVSTTSSQIGAVVELCKRGEQFVSIIDMDHVLDLDAHGA
jgi:purine-binding chemotaxis protein CheW